MKERDYKLALSPFHPFTPRQAEVVELVANGASYKELVKKLGVSWGTIKKHISNCPTYDSIFDTIEDLTGERPQRKNWIVPLIDDILFFRSSG